MTVQPSIVSLEEFEAEAVEALRPPFRSRFGALRWEDQDRPAAKAYEWQVYGLFPRRETVLWYGESQSGKSFSGFDAGVHIASGREYQGRRTRRGGVVYCFVEKGHGARNRMQAFRQVHDLPLELPFVALTKRFDIFAEEQTVKDLAAECNHLAEPWDCSLDVIVIDTHDKASPGASELDKKDVSLVLKRYGMLGELTGAAVWIIGHSNAFGSLRGSLVLFNAIETVVAVAPMCGPDKLPFRDANGRIIREAVVKKQSEGEAGTRWTFTLPAIDVGKNEYGEPVTSCVVSPPAKQEGEGPLNQKGFEPTTNDALFLKALLKAMEEHGTVPPPMLGLPPSIKTVVHYDHVKTAFRDTNPDDGDDEDKWRERLKKQLQRARERLQKVRIIGVASPFTWLTGKAVKGLIRGAAEQLAVHPEDEPSSVADEAEGLQF